MNRQSWLGPLAGIIKSLVEPIPIIAGGPNAPSLRGLRGSSRRGGGAREAKEICIHKREGQSKPR